MDDDRTLEAILELALFPDNHALLVLLLGSLEVALVLVLLLALHLLIVPLPAVLQIEPDGVVKVELDGAALMLALHGIRKPDVDLGTIEGTITRIQGPLPAGLVQGGLELALGVVPDLLGAECLLWPGRQSKGCLEPEEAVYVVQELEPSCHLLLDLIRPHEQVTIVLLEAAHTHKPRKSTAGLVPVQNTEIGEPHGHLLVASHTGIEHDEVAWAIHRLQKPVLLLDVQAVHVVLVVLVVPRNLEER
mmetsp:Transcript_85749/g.275706  ORF Transcript_85749/g.275706 Transcript_85749/m.275706 type:complete len:247 (-) Transcript_85749:1214-1954(-)